MTLQTRNVYLYISLSINIKYYRKEKCYKIVIMRLFSNFKLLTWIKCRLFIILGHYKNSLNISSRHFFLQTNKQNVAKKHCQTAIPFNAFVYRVSPFIAFQFRFVIILSLLNILRVIDQSIHRGFYI